MRQSIKPKPSMHTPVLDDDSQPNAPTFQSQLDACHVKVFPASRHAIRVKVCNSGATPAQFRMDAKGLPADWITPDQLRFQLPAWETTELRFVIRPQRDATVPPQVYPLDIAITRLGAKAETLNLRCAVELGGYGGPSLDIDPRGPLHDGSFQIRLRNQGNEPLDLSLQCHDSASRLAYRLSQPSARLLPGQGATIQAEARPKRRPLTGKPRQLPFIVVAEAQEPANYQAALALELYVKPFVPRAVAALLLTAILAAAILAAMLLYQPPQPAIHSFSLSQVQVAQGTAVALAWRAEHAGRYVIEVDGLSVADLPGGAESYSLDTSGYRDPVDIVLIAQRGQLSASAQRQLDIYEPVNILQFYTDRTTMLRRVIGTITARWQVEGARSLEVIPPPDFQVVSASPASSPQGSLSLRGAPERDFAFTLSAMDELGKISRQTIQITLRDPECAPRGDALLYAGPDARHLKVGIAAANVPVIVLGANAEGDWLQVELARGEIGWGARQSFFCPGFSPASLSIISEVPALPTATPVPIPPDA